MKLTQDQKLFVGLRWREVVLDTDLHQKLRRDQLIKFIEGRYAGLPVIGAVKLNCPDGEYESILIIKVVKLERDTKLLLCFTRPIYLLYPLMNSDFSNFSTPTLDDYIIDHANVD